MTYQKSWLIILTVIVALILLFLAKQVFAPKEAQAQTVVRTIIVSDVASQIASSTFERIAWCESMGSTTIKNPNSTASGKYQWLDSSWEFYGKMLWGDQWVKHDKLNGNDSTILAAFAYGKNGTKDWLESQPCWDR